MSKRIVLSTINLYISTYHLDDEKLTAPNYSQRVAYESNSKIASLSLYNPDLIHFKGLSKSAVQEAYAENYHSSMSEVENLVTILQARASEDELATKTFGDFLADAAGVIRTDWFGISLHSKRNPGTYITSKLIRSYADFAALDKSDSARYLAEYLKHYKRIKLAHLLAFPENIQARIACTDLTPVAQQQLRTQLKIRELILGIQNNDYLGMPFTEASLSGLPLTYSLRSDYYKNNPPPEYLVGLANDPVFEAEFGYKDKEVVRSKGKTLHEWVATIRSVVGQTFGKSLIIEHNNTSTITPPTMAFQFAVSMPTIPSIPMKDEADILESISGNPQVLFTQLDEYLATGVLQSEIDKVLELDDTLPIPQKTPSIIVVHDEDTQHPIYGKVLRTHLNKNMRHVWGDEVVKIENPESIVKRLTFITNLFKSKLLAPELTPKSSNHTLSQLEYLDPKFFSSSKNLDSKMQYQWSLNLPALRALRILLDMTNNSEALLYSVEISNWLDSYLEQVRDTDPLLEDKLIQAIDIYAATCRVVGSTLHALVDKISPLDIESSRVSWSYGDILTNKEYKAKRTSPDKDIISLLLRKDTE